MVISLIPSRGNSRIKRGSVIVHNIFAYFALSLSTAQVYMIKERCWFSRIDFCVELFPHQINIVVSLSTNFMSSTYTDKKNPFSRRTKESFPVGNFLPSMFQKGFSQIAFPIIVLPKDDRTDSVREEQLHLPYWTMI